MIFMESNKARRNASIKGQSSDNECISITSVVFQRRPSTTTKEDSNESFCNPSNSSHQERHDEESVLQVDDIIDHIVAKPTPSSAVSAITMWTKTSRWTRATYDETSELPSINPPLDDEYELDFCQQLFGHPMFSNLNASLFIVLMGLVHYVFSGL